MIQSLPWGKFSGMAQAKPLACSGGTIFAGQQGEKRTRWQVLRQCCFLSCGRWQSGRAVVMAASSYFNQTGSNRCAKPRGQLELRGMTAPCFFCLFFLLARPKFDSQGKESRSKKWEKDNKREEMWSVTSFLLSPLCNQRDIAGGKHWELSLPTGPRASCRDR